MIGDGTLAEIHARASVEGAATEAREQLQKITDSMPGTVFELLWLGKGQLEFLYVNEGIARTSGGLTGSHLEPTATILDLVHPDDLPGLLTGVDVAAQSKQGHFDALFRVRNAVSGALVWIQMQAFARPRVEGGMLFYGSFTDVTVRKRLEDVAVASERLLKAAMKASNDGVWEWDLRTDAMYLSPRWGEMLGYHDQDLAMRLETFTRLCHPADQHDCFARMAAAVESGSDGRFSKEFRLLCKDGSWRWVLGQGRVSLRSGSGQATLLTGTISNIDEHKRLETSLADATQRAQSASKAKGDFLANMSHEIRTPMNAVLGLSHLLGDTRLDVQQRGYLDKLQMASRTLLSIINDVLDISKIEAGKLNIEHVPFSLSALLGNLDTLTASVAASKNIRLVHHSQAHTADVLLGDSMRLGQVLLNLVGNAMKFGEGGDVRLTVSSLMPAEGVVALRFEIADAGIGISADRISALFAPFEQADGSTSRRYGGTGLGLAICRHLVTLMGGEIGVQSVLGEGSAFWFTVRAGVAPAGALEPLQLPKSEDISALKGLRVLIAEDNEINLEIVADILTRVGIEVRVARDGGEAVAACANGWPQMVLMDMQMPDIDGLAATIMLRRDPRFTNLPIIALTANAMTDDRARCLAAGMTDHLPKPIEVANLYAMLLLWKPK